MDTRATLTKWHKNFLKYQSNSLWQVKPLEEPIDMEHAVKVIEDLDHVQGLNFTARFFGSKE